MLLRMRALLLAGAVTQALVNCAATAVQDFRLGLASIEEATSADEAELAGQWRQFHEFDAKLIDSPSHFLSLLRGTLVWLNILDRPGVPISAPGLTAAVER